jgi:undecaprenyl-phosphate galactose phosphotransferase
MKKKVIAFFSLVIVDAAAIILSYVLAYFIRLSILPTALARYRAIRLYPFYVFLENYYLVFVWLAVFAYHRLYTKRFPFWEEVKKIIQSSTISSLMVIIIIFLTKTEANYSRTVVVLAWLLSLLLVPFLRYYLKLAMTKLKIWRKKLILIGLNPTSQKAIENIRKNKFMGYEVVSIIDDDPANFGRTVLGVPVTGPLSRFEEFSRTSNSKDVMIASPHLSGEELKRLIARSERGCESMWIVPRTGDFLTEGVEIQKIGDLLSLYVKRNLAKPWNIVVKSVFEWSLTVVALVVLAPVFLFIALAIKRDSPGSVLYLQERVGKNKRPFTLWKFRSMYLDSEQRLQEYLLNDSRARAEWETFRKLRNHDPRVTRIGRFLRKYSLDELPQLVQVLQGKMSLVGPRPYIEEELQGKDPLVDTITQVKPGITGLWQISGRSEVAFDERISLDEYYVRNWSPWLDAVILLKTAKTLLSGRGAY